MDPERFDSFTRAFATTTSRRRVLLGAAGSVAAAALGLRGSRSAGAAPGCRTAGHPCEGNQICCSGLICTSSGPGAALRCTACPAGTQACGTTCAACCTDSDCPGATCSMGSCVAGQC